MHALLEQHLGSEARGRPPPPPTPSVPWLPHTEPRAQVRFALHLTCFWHKRLCASTAWLVAPFGPRRSMRSRMPKVEPVAREEQAQFLLGTNS